MMKRTEFVDLINTIAQEEREQIAKTFEQIQQTSEQPTIDLFVESVLQAADVSARTAAKIIERSGLVQFDD